MIRGATTHVTALRDALRPIDRGDRLRSHRHQGPDKQGAAYEFACCPPEHARQLPVWRELQVSSMELQGPIPSSSRPVAVPKTAGESRGRPVFPGRWMDQRLSGNQVPPFGTSLTCGGGERSSEAGNPACDILGDSHRSRDGANSVVLHRKTRPKIRTRRCYGQQHASIRATVEWVRLSKISRFLEQRTACLLTSSFGAATPSTQVREMIVGLVRVAGL